MYTYEFNKLDMGISNVKLIVYILGFLSFQRQDAT